MSTTPPTQHSDADKPPVCAAVVAAEPDSPPVRRPPRAAPSRTPVRGRSAGSDQQTPNQTLEHVYQAWEVAGRLWECFFGAISMIIALAVLATIPVLNLLSLGYLLEASGRVARTGKLREGFVGVRKAYRLGSLVLGTYLMLLPLQFISDIWYTSSLIDPRSGITFGWRMALGIVTVLMVGHILLAWYAGGKLRHFFWPLLFPLEMLYGIVIWQWRREVVHNQWPPPILLLQGIWKGDMYTASRDTVWDFVTGLRLPYYFWLGLRGFVGTMAWLAFPVLVLIVAANLSEGPGAALGFLGSMMLAVVVLYLPLLQAHFAAENRFAAFFEWWPVRMLFRRAPLAFFLAMAATLLFAIPLYLLKIEAMPREVTWLPALLFVMFIFPVRLIAGWAMGRARRRSQPRFVLSRWIARLACIPIVLTYVFFVYLSQYTYFYGSFSFLDQHAFLLPVPFLGM